MNQRTLSFCGIIAPLLFIFMAILGAAMRPGYSHISDTVSELMSPGSPNKLILDILYTTFGVLLIFFGFGILKLVRETKPVKRTGLIGAVLFIAMGCLNVTTATVFPQDAWGSAPTFAGEMHILLHGLIGILGVFYILLFGIWSIQTGIFPGLGVHSFVTIGAVAVSTGFFMANTGSPTIGLTERILALVGFQWTFILALRMFFRKENQGGFNEGGAC